MGGILGTFILPKLMIFYKRVIKSTKISKAAPKLDTEQPKYSFESDNDEYVQNVFETLIMWVVYCKYVIFVGNRRMFVLLLLNIISI